jgi:hypothetical protein
MGGEASVGPGVVSDDMEQNEVCMYACMHVCTRMRLHSLAWMVGAAHVIVCACIIHTCMCISGEVIVGHGIASNDMGQTGVCMYVSMICMCACMYVCMHACMYVCSYLFMYACMYICINERARLYTPSIVDIGHL